MDNMYLDNIGYHTYEESEYIQLHHEKTFGKNEFEEIVIKATINVLKTREIREGKHISFQPLLYDVVGELIKNFGFKKVEFTSEFSVFGWADILDEEDWERNRDEQLNLLTKAIKNEKGNLESRR